MWWYLSFCFFCVERRMKTHEIIETKRKKECCALEFEDLPKRSRAAKDEAMSGKTGRNAGETQYIQSMNNQLSSMKYVDSR